MFVVVCWRENAEIDRNQHFQPELLIDGFLGARGVRVAVAASPPRLGAAARRLELLRATAGGCGGADSGLLPSLGEVENGFGEPKMSRGAKTTAGESAAWRRLSGRLDDDLSPRGHCADRALCQGRFCVAHSAQGTSLEGISGTFAVSLRHDGRRLPNCRWNLFA